MVVAELVGVIEPGLPAGRVFPLRSGVCQQPGHAERHHAQDRAGPVRECPERVLQLPPVVLVHWVHGSVQQLLFPRRGVLRRREIGHAHDGGPVLSGASQAAAGGLGQVAAGLAGTRRQELGLQQAQQRHLLSIGALQRQIQALRQPGPGEIQIADELAHGEHGGTIEVKIALAGRQLPLAGVPAFQHRERHIKIAELCVDIRDRALAEDPRT